MSLKKNTIKVGIILKLRAKLLNHRRFNFFFIFIIQLYEGIVYASENL